METKTIRVMVSLTKNYQKAEVEMVVVPSGDELPGQCSEQAEAYCLEQAKKTLEAAIVASGADQVAQYKPVAPSQTQQAYSRPYPGAPAQQYAASDRKPVTMGQIKFLKMLGYAGAFENLSSFDASKIIDQLKNNQAKQ
jgi:hypothetical protein